MTHFEVNLWPTPALLSSLPPTIELLAVHLDTGPLADNDDYDDEHEAQACESELVARLADVKRGKTSVLPAIRALRIRTRYDHRVEALATEVHDFEVVSNEDVWRCFPGTLW